MYNDIKSLLLRLPRYNAASQLFANIDVPTFQTVIRNLILKSITRLNRSENAITEGRVKMGEDDLRLTSATWRHWYKLLNVDEHVDSG